MLVAIAALLIQSTSLADVLSSDLKDQKVVLSRYIDCVDADAKVQMKAHFLDSTSESVADASLKTCESIREELRVKAVETLAAAMPRADAEAQANKLGTVGIHRELMTAAVR